METSGVRRGAVVRASTNLLEPERAQPCHVDSDEPSWSGTLCTTYTRLGPRAVVPTYVRGGSRRRVIWRGRDARLGMSGTQARGPPVHLLLAAISGRPLCHRTKDGRAMVGYWPWLRRGPEAARLNSLTCGGTDLQIWEPLLEVSRWRVARGSGVVCESLTNGRKNSRDLQDVAQPWESPSSVDVPNQGNDKPAYGLG